jgi:hypothetical protein
MGIQWTRELSRRRKSALRELETFELSLARLEKWRGLPSPRAASIVDRMASLHISKDLIEYVDEMLSSVSH